MNVVRKRAVRKGRPDADAGLGTALAIPATSRVSTQGVGSSLPRRERFYPFGDPPRTDLRGGTRALVVPRRMPGQQVVTLHGDECRRQSEETTMMTIAPMMASETVPRLISSIDRGILDR
jgi:hypothetical protein